MNALHPRIPRQTGMALVTSLLLLVVITILALSMFRSFGTQEKIAGNLREKERALHAAESAQQYAEWWLLQGNNVAIGAVTCAPGTLIASVAVGQICTQTAQQQFGVANMTQVPWNIQVSYTPQGMVIQNAGYVPTAGNNNPPYFASPAFYIADRGPADGGNGEAYQIDAYGYGSAASTVAVVESVYVVQQGMVNRGNL
jgi:type IV pilus assembly protein PilX